MKPDLRLQPPPKSVVGNRGALPDSKPAAEAGGFAAAVALLPDEAAGKIATVSAGAAVFEAVFVPRPGDGLCDVQFVHGPSQAVRFVARTVEVDPVSLDVSIRLEIRALRRDHLSKALENLLREAANFAALADAIFEARVHHLADPAVHPAPLVQALALDLRDAGIPVNFGRSWTPVAGAPVAVGVGGMEVEVEAFFEESSGRWEALPVTGWSHPGRARGVPDRGLDR